MHEPETRERLRSSRRALARRLALGVALMGGAGAGGAGAEGYEPGAQPTTAPANGPEIQGPVARGVAALAKAGEGGADLAVLWGVPTSGQVDQVRAAAQSALTALREGVLSDDEQAVVLGRVLALRALSARADERGAARDEARALLERVEGPPTAGEGVRRLSLAAVLADGAANEEADAASREADRAAGEALVRSVLDLPVGDAPAQSVPPAAQLEALAALIALAPDDERAARTAEVAGERFGNAAQRALIAEALARRAAFGLRAPPEALGSERDKADEARRAAWARAIKPLLALEGSTAYAEDAERRAATIEGKVAWLTREVARLEELPVAALLARGTVDSLEAAAARAGARTEDALDALRRLASAHRGAKPPRRAAAIDAQARAVERFPKHREIESVLRRAQQDLDEWERALLNGPWKKQAGAAAPEDELEDALAGIERLRRAVAAQGRTDALESRVRQREARLMIRGGRARGAWGERALEALACVNDDPGVSDQTVALARAFLEERHPANAPGGASAIDASAAAQALATDLERVLGHPTLKRQPWQLVSWRSRLAEAQRASGAHEAALATWHAMLDDQSAPYLPQGESTARLGLAANLRALRRYDEADAQLERLIAPYDSALASRPPAYWQAWGERLAIDLERHAGGERAGDARARVLLRIRQLRAQDATLGTPGTRAALEALEARAQEK